MTGAISQVRECYQFLFPLDEKPICRAGRLVRRAVGRRPKDALAPPAQRFDLYPNDLRSKNRLADGVAGSEFESLSERCESGTLNAPPTAAFPKPAEQHWDF